MLSAGPAQRPVDRVLDRVRAQFAARGLQGLLVNVNEVLAHAIQYIRRLRRIDPIRRSNEPGRRLGSAQRMSIGIDGQMLVDGRKQVRAWIAARGEVLPDGAFGMPSTTGK